MTDAAKVLPDPHRMPWEALSAALWSRFKDDDREDDDLCVSRAEACALLSWAGQFDRAAQPRRDDEERSFAIIRDASENLRPGDGEVIFYLRIADDQAQVHTIAGKGVQPQDALSKAMDALRAEYADAENCPIHKTAAQGGIA